MTRSYGDEYCQVTCKHPMNMQLLSNKAIRCQQESKPVDTKTNSSIQHPDNNHIIFSGQRVLFLKARKLFSQAFSSCLVQWVNCFGTSMQPYLLPVSFAFARLDESFSRHQNPAHKTSTSHWKQRLQ